MTWETIALFAVRYGLPLAEALVTKWEAGTIPSSQDLADLRQQAGQSAEDEAKKVLGSLNIALDSEEAKRLLVLVK